VDDRDRAFLGDLYNFSGSNRAVTAIALYHAGLDAEQVAVDQHALIDRLNTADAVARARELRTAARVQSIAMARLVGEVAAALEDCGGLCVAIRERDRGLFRRYLKSSAQEVDRFYDELLSMPDPDIVALLRLPAASDVLDPSARTELQGMYDALGASLSSIAAAYRTTGDTRLWDPSDTDAPALDDQIKVVLDVSGTESSNADRIAAANVDERGLLALVVNKLKHRFTVFDDLSGLAAGKGGIRFAHYRRDPVAASQLLEAVANITRTIEALAQLLLYLDSLELLNEAD
jgi:hypothetical protein